MAPAEAGCPLRRQHRHEDAARGTLRGRYSLIEPLLRLDGDDAGKDRPQPAAAALEHIVETHHEAARRGWEIERVRPCRRREIGFPEQFGELAARIGPAGAEG